MAVYLNFSGDRREIEWIARPPISRTRATRRRPRHADDFPVDGRELPILSPAGDKAGTFRFRLKAGSGEVIATSETYSSKTAAQKGIESVRPDPADVDGAVCAKCVDLGGEAAHGCLSADDFAGGEGDGGLAVGEHDEVMAAGAVGEPGF